MSAGWSSYFPRYIRGAACLHERQALISPTPGIQGGSMWARGAARSWLLQALPSVHRCVCTVRPQLAPSHQRSRLAVSSPERASSSCSTEVGVGLLAPPFSNSSSLYGELGEDSLSPMKSSASASWHSPTCHMPMAAKFSLLHLRNLAASQLNIDLNKRSTSHSRQDCSAVRLGVCDADNHPDWR